MGTRLYDALPMAGFKHNRYCGPAALSALTGIKTGDAAALLREVSGKLAIRGTSAETMLAALAKSGLRVTRTESYYPQTTLTLRRWLDEKYTGGLCLVSAANHWWAIDRGFYVDSFYRVPNPVGNIHKPRAQVCKVFYLKPE